MIDEQLLSPVKVVESKHIEVTPTCAHYTVCSGCSLQHLSLASQVKLKQTNLVEMFKAVGLEPKEVKEPIVGPAYGYRHKARLSVRYVEKKQKVLVGFRELNGRWVTDSKECHTLIPRVGTKIVELAKLIESLTAAKSIPQLEIAAGDKAVAIVFRNLVELTLDDKQKIKDFGLVHDFICYLQPGGPKTIDLLSDAPANLTYTLPKWQLEFTFQPLDFIQINPFINKQMVAAAVQLLEPSKADNILDLFCGLGNFSLPLAKYGANILGVEGDAAMVARAKMNAASNAISNADFRALNLMQESVVAQLNFNCNKVCLDPPRAGAGIMLPCLNSLRPSSIVYISCNAETLVKDSKALVQDYGYSLASLTSIDMFPQTKHSEAMAHFVL